MDCGTVRSLNDASNYIRVIEERQSLKVGVIEEIAWRNGWISANELGLLAKSFAGNEYGDYLQRLVK
jgi:glucose-1-phosphate thymidylyltransferase